MNQLTELPVLQSFLDPFLLLRVRNFASGRNQGPKALHIHIPKTAGTAISRWMDEEIGLVNMRSKKALFGPQIPTKDYVLYLGHLSSDLPIKAGVFSRAQFEQTYSFTFVRHPVSRLISLYRHLQSWDRLEGSFEEFVDISIDPAAIPDLRLRRQVAHMSRPMVHWAFPKRWRGPQFIYRQEDFQSGVDAIAKHLKIGNEPKVVGRSDSSIGALEVSQGCLAKISDKYDEDFLRFGYNPSEGF